MYVHVLVIFRPLICVKYLTLMVDIRLSGISVVITKMAGYGKVCKTQNFDLKNFFKNRNYFMPCFKL